MTRVSNFKNLALFCKLKTFLTQGAAQVMDVHHAKAMLNNRRFKVAHCLVKRFLCFNNIIHISPRLNVY